MLQSLDSASWEIWAPLAIFLLLAGLVGAALAARRRAARARDREFDAYRNAVGALLGGDLEAASKALRTAADQNSARIETYLSLGRIIRSLGDPERALRVHQSLLVRQGIAPGLRLEALRDAAVYEPAAGRPKEALALLDEVLAKRRKDREALAAAVEAHARLGHWEAAYENRRRFDRLDGSAQPALLARLMAARARQLLAQNDPVGARKALKKAIGAHAGSVQALLALGDAALLEGKGEKAVEAWEKILKTDPRRAAALFPRLEQAHYAIGDVDRLEAILRRLAGERPDDANAHLLLGRHLAKKQRVDDALGSLKRAIDLEPENVVAHRERCRLRLEHGPQADLEGDFRALLDALQAAPPVTPLAVGTASPLEGMLQADERRAWELIPAPKSQN